MGHKVLILQDIDPAGKEYLKEHNCDLFISQEQTEEGYIKEIREIQPEVLFARIHLVSAAMMDAASTIKVIARHGVGYDGVDLEHATAKKIKVVCVPEGNFISVAEHAMLLILACAKRYGQLSEAFREGNYGIRNDILEACELRGKVLGIIGCGRIGTALAEMAAKGFGMKVLGYSRHLVPGVKDKEVDFLAVAKEDLIKKADFLVIALPSTPETKHSFKYETFKNMKKTSYFINISRGNIVVEADLLRALNENLISGAGLDVFEVEQPQMENPLLKMNNVIATPHFAGLTKDALARISLDGAKQIVDVLEGREPKWPVN